MFRAAWKVPSPFPSSTETDAASALKFATARSCNPSPLRSPTATHKGPRPVFKVCAGWNVPFPLPSSTAIEVALPPPKVATARSARPSRLKSPTTTQLGLLPEPTEKFRGAWNVPSPLPSSTETSPES